MEVNYLLDNKLSLADKGIAALLLAMNDNGISPTVETIREYCPNGVISIRNIIQHLEECGYLQRIEAREQGRRKVIYNIRKTPDFLPR